MGDDNHPITGLVDVGFEGIHAPLERPREAHKGVFREFRGGAAMAINEGAGHARRLLETAASCGTSPRRLPVRLGSPPMLRPSLFAAPLLACALFSCKKTELPPAPLQSGTVPIAVTDEGFTPSKVRLEKGKPATLVFTRTSAHTCAERVKFKALNVDEALPLQTPVSIKVPTETAQTLTFTCGMDMYASSVVVE